MIRYAVTKAKLDADITALNATWFADTAAVLAGLPSPPSSSDCKPLWSKIKQLYIDLQNSKCCFCEKPLEGKIEQDVEHFRPKAEVKPWKVPAKLIAEGVTSRHPGEHGARVLQRNDHHRNRFSVRQRRRDMGMRAGRDAKASARPNLRVANPSKGFRVLVTAPTKK